VTAVLDGLSAPAMGAGESQAVGLGALSLAMLAVSVDGTCSAWRCPHRPECCTRRSRTCNGSRRDTSSCSPPRCSRPCRRTSRGMDMALLVSADTALAAIVFTLPFLSASNAPKKAAQPVMPGSSPFCVHAAAMHGFCGNAKRRR